MTDRATRARRLDLSSSAAWAIGDGLIQLHLRTESGRVIDVVVTPGGCLDLIRQMASAASQGLQRMVKS